MTVPEGRYSLTAAGGGLLKSGQPPNPALGVKGTGGKPAEAHPQARKPCHTREGVFSSSILLEKGNRCMTITIWARTAVR
jgi:hypothetical protein